MDRYNVPEAPVLIVAPYGSVYSSHKLGPYYPMPFDLDSLLCDIFIES